jgi:hypothetical protein
VRPDHAEPHIEELKTMPRLAAVLLALLCAAASFAQPGPYHG